MNQIKFVFSNTLEYNYLCFFPQNMPLRKQMSLSIFVYKPIEFLEIDESTFAFDMVIVNLSNILAYIYYN